MKQLYPQKTPAKTSETPSNNGKNKKQTTTIEEDSKILLRRKGAIEKNRTSVHQKHGMYSLTRNGTPNNSATALTFSTLTSGILTAETSTSNATTFAFLMNSSTAAKPPSNCGLQFSA